jgi:hypothetical protein
MALGRRKMQPLVETVAESIGDPVRRLRFLQTVAPMVDIRGVRRRRRRAILRGVLLLLALGAGLAGWSFTRVNPPAAPPPEIRSTPPATRVWLVEHAAGLDTYSNGLHVENAFSVPNRPREVTAGIVFHATESPQETFSPDHNDALKRIGESLLDYVRRRQSYHFVIDRFGRVFRVVAQADAANHAGHSVWADGHELYAGLNDSFLGVAFEARNEITAAQIRSGAMLTEMLRSAYAIPAENCVTHAQVSVNPSNMRMGYHVDWAAGLPFAGLGLPDNYRIPPPAVWAFGFQADASFRAVAGAPLRLALDAAAGAVQPGARERYRAISTSGRKKNTMPRIR